MFFAAGALVCASVLPFEARFYQCDRVGRVVNFSSIDVGPNDEPRRYYVKFRGCNTDYAATEWMVYVDANFLTEIHSSKECQ